jgi:hypothetical protein
LITGSFPIVDAAVDFFRDRVNQRDGLMIQVAVRDLRAALCHASGPQVCGSSGARYQLSHGGVAVFIAERQDLLQSDTYVGLISFNVTWG